MAFVMDFKNPDFLWATLDIAIWSDVEQGLAITAGSLATLRPLYRKLASKLGFDTTGKMGESKTSGMASPKWYGAPTADDQRKKGIFGFGSRLRSEKGTVRNNEEEYGLGDLQPMRLRDDLIEEGSIEKSEKGFNAWTIEAGKSIDEEPILKPKTGHITLQKQVIQASERRSDEGRP
jgi:hypothetical protein